MSVPQGHHTYLFEFRPPIHEATITHASSTAHFATDEDTIIRARQIRTEYGVEAVKVPESIQT